MHAFVVTFFEQGFDPRSHVLVETLRANEQRYTPSIVSLHAPHRVQVSEHAGNHARDACDTFQKDVPDQIFLLGHGELLACCDGIFCVYVECFVVLVSCRLIETPPQYLDSKESDLVGHGLRFAVSDHYLIHLLFSVY